MMIALVITFLIILILIIPKALAYENGKDRIQKNKTIKKSEICTTNANDSNIYVKLKVSIFENYEIPNIDTDEDWNFYLLAKFKGEEYFYIKKDVVKKFIQSHPSLILKEDMYGIYKIILDRRTQIINESLDIISSTNNIITIERRYNEIRENITFINQYTEVNSLSLKNKDPKFLEKVDLHFNENLIRLLNKMKEDYKLKIFTLKNIKAIDNRTAEIFKNVEYSKTLLKPTINIEQNHSEIENIYFEIENIYSDRTLTNI